MHNAYSLISTKSFIQVSSFGCDLISSLKKRAALVSCVNSSEAAVLDKSNGSVKKNTSTGSTFLMALRNLSLVYVNETQIAELKMKIGGFEMHVKRKIKSAEAIMPVAPPVPVRPITEYAPANPPPNQTTSPFTKVQKSRKLAALEASGASGYVLVSCPMVGTFRKVRTFKGKKQPALIKEGDAIKEGQTICYLDQFGTELPVKVLPSE